MKGLRLKVNSAKSAVGDIGSRTSLGFCFTRGNVACRRIAPTSLKRLQERVREITRRTRGIKFRNLITELSRYVRGWRSYYDYCETPSVLRRMDSWIRRRLRAYLWQQWKHRSRRYRALRKLDILHGLAVELAGSGRGAWRISASPMLCYALPNALFAQLGLVQLAPDS